MKKIVASWKNRFEKPEPFKAAAKEFEEFFKEHKPNDLQALLNRIAKRQRTAGCTYLKVETPLRNKVSDELSEILSSREKIKEAVVAVDRTPEQRERAAKASARMKAQWGSTF
jgi:isocitrate lyase